MTTAKIDIVGPDEYELICHLYNAIFRPPREDTFFRRRLANRQGVLAMVAEVEKRAVGFYCGYELRPTTYYTWLCGVLPDGRRLGVATQLLEAAHAWAQERGYEMTRLECYNQQRPMLSMAVHAGYDVVGIRWDGQTSNNHIIFEKSLAEDEG